jgi:phage tail-like protein
MDAQDPRAPEIKFRLHIQGPESEQVFDIPLGSAIVGRQPGSDVLLPDPKVSRRHAQIDCQQTSKGLECRITDLGSSNGTWLNDEQLSPNAPIVLEPGARIRIGEFELKLEALQLEAKPTPAESKATVELPEPPPPEPEIERVSLRPSPPPAEPPPPPPHLDELGEPEGEHVPPGLTIHSQRLLGYLPGIYQDDFMARFLGIFEAILMPLEWNIDNFDLFLDPGTAPPGFLPWLEKWFRLPPGASWGEEQRRIFLKEAHLLYSRRGTRWALERALEIYLGRAPEITDDAEELEPFTFRVKIPLRRREVKPDLIEAIIEASKPAHTTYILEYKK